jgi:glyoxylase-like metal-dependent hydrolase (beta-lactamase superfamily II)
MKLITLHNNDVYQIKVPLPFPLRWVNSYLIRGDDGYTLMDPGLHTEAAEQCWEQVLQELSIDYRDIKQIVLTHHHPDHYGLTGYFQQLADAPVYLSSLGYEQVRLLWGDGQPMSEALLSLFQANGLPEEQLGPMQKHMVEFVPMVSPQPQVSLISAGEEMTLGNYAYETLHTPGHASGHICFYREETKEIFCGDHVIPQISPNVGYLPGGIDENPLGSFLQSLREIGRYEVNRAYPGHRDPFETFTQRTLELIAHHDTRLELMRQALIAQPQTAYQVCRSTFGDRLTLHQLRFALSETIAHLIYLHKAGLVSQAEQDELIQYQAV